MGGGEGQCGEKCNSDLKGEAGCSIGAHRVAVMRHPLHSLFVIILPKEQPLSYRAAFC